MANPTVLLDVDDGVATVTLNRPERRNGLADDMLTRLHATLTQTAADPGIAVVVLRGAGADFCVGADIKAFPDGVSGKTDYQIVARLYHTATLLHEMPQITIAAVDGGCAGAGLGFAAACDVRFASDRAVFATAFIKVNVAGDMGTTWSLSRIVGPARARDLMLFSDKVRSAEALSLGLVSRLFPADQLHVETRRLARELAGRSRLALQIMKANFLSAERVGMAEYVEIEGARHSHVVVSDATTEAFRNFGKAGSTAAKA